MTIHQAVYDKLRTDAGITPLVGTRIYPQKALQGVVLPCVVYQRISTSGRFLYHTGAVPAAITTFQIDCWADSLTKAVELSDAVVACLHGWYGTQSGMTIYSSQVVNQQDGFDLETGEYVVPVDVEIFHKEVN